MFLSQIRARGLAAPPSLPSATHPHNLPASSIGVLMFWFLIDPGCKPLVLRLPIIGGTWILSITCSGGEDILRLGNCGTPNPCNALNPLSLSFPLPNLKLPNLPPGLARPGSEIGPFLTLILREKLGQPCLSIIRSLP